MGCEKSSHMTDFQTWSKKNDLYSFWVFYIVLHENDTNWYNFDILLKVRERATIIILEEILCKKEGRYPEEDVDIEVK